MLVEFLYHFFAFDLAWIINEVILAHIFWVFVFLACAVIFFEPKKQFWGFIFLVFLVWAIVDAGVYMGWHLVNYFGPVQLIFGSLVAFTFLEKNGKLSKWNIPYVIFFTLALWAFTTFFG